METTYRRSKIGTQRRQAILDFVAAYRAENGFGPTDSEIAAAVYGDTMAKGNVHTMIDSLIAEGWLMRIKGVARSLRLVEPDMTMRYGDKA